MNTGKQEAKATEFIRTHPATIKDTTPVECEKTANIYTAARLQALDVWEKLSPEGQKALPLPTLISLFVRKIQREQEGHDHGGEA